MTTGDETQQAKDTRTHVPLAEAVHLFSAAGVLRSERTLSRYCENGALHCIKEPFASGAMGYLVSRESIQDRIIELKQMGMTGHVATGQDTSRHDATRQDTSRHDETATKAAEDRAKKAEIERDELREENMQLKIDVGVRKGLLNEAKRLTDQMMGERDQLMRHVGSLEGQVRQLGAAPVERLTLPVESSVGEQSQQAHDSGEAPPGEMRNS